MIADPHLNAFDSRVQMSYALSRNGLQSSIDILLSVPVRSNNPDIIERAIPILCKAVKERSGNTSDKDVVDYLESLAKEMPATATRNLVFQMPRA